MSKAFFTNLLELMFSITVLFIFWEYFLIFLLSQLQNFLVDEILARSSGECAPLIVGPKEIHIYFGVVLSQNTAF